MALRITEIQFLGGPHDGRIIRHKKAVSIFDHTKFMIANDDPVDWIITDGQETEPAFPHRYTFIGYKHDGHVVRGFFSCLATKFTKEETT